MAGGVPLGMVMTGSAETSTCPFLVRTVDADPLGQMEHVGWSLVT